MKRCTRILMVVYFSTMMAGTFPSFAESSPTRTDHFYTPPSKDLVGGWLSDLTGLPDTNQVDLFTKRILKLMSEDKDKKCRQIHVHLRLMVFQHFLIYQHMANSQNVYFDDQVARKWAHILAMILRESSGDSTNVSDMRGHSVSTYSAHTNLQHWKNLFKNAVQKHITLNYQTNFGLTQLSADRLYVAFNLANNQSYEAELLKGKEGTAISKKEDLNTAIAIRRLVWFYQDFAQGRISSSDNRIYHNKINNPKYSARYRTGFKLALMYCGTHFLFHKKNTPMEKKQHSKLEKAIASIAYCKLGNDRTGYGRDKFDKKCFAEWVTLCPALNIDMALLTPLKYFETRNAHPVCEGMFKRLINKKPADRN